MSSDCENLRDSNTLKQCVVSIFSLIQIFKEQNFAVHLFRFTLKFSCVRSKDGGAMRDRTADLLRAKQALSQLSYSPIGVISVPVIFPETRRGEAKHTEVCELCHNAVFRENLVGLSGLEPPTSPLSGVRSNHLSYKPAEIIYCSISSDNLCEHYKGRFFKVRR